MRAAKFCAICFLIFLVSLGNRRGYAFGDDDAKNAYCSAPEYRQFDFWLGDWDVYEIGGKVPVAHAKVETALNGCAVRERYFAADGHIGESLSIYDKSRGVWHQSWFTNRGQFLAIEGGFSGAAMVLTGSDRTTDGKARLVRGRWKAEGNNVRETARRSTDNGKTWQAWFDLEFRPRR
jgi:hypothetical protein